MRRYGLSHSVSRLRQGAVSWLSFPAFLFRFTLFSIAIFFLFAGLIFAQVTPDLEQGMKPYGSYHGGDLDHISMSNGNLFFHTDLMTYSQRGDLSYPIVLQYNGENFSLFQQTCPSTTKPGQCPVYEVFGPAWVMNRVSRGNSVSIGVEAPPRVIPSGGPGLGINTTLAMNGNPIYVQLYSVLTSDGSLHQLVNTNAGQMTLDGSGFSTASGNLTDRHGNKYGNVAEDANGNQINYSTGADTLNRQIPAPPINGSFAISSVSSPPASTASLSACPSLGYTNQAVTYAYAWNPPTVNGSTLPLTLCYTSVYVNTGGDTGYFHGVHESFLMLQSVVFPDNTYWAFQYDAGDPNNSSLFAVADLLKVTFPTGGSISYTWTTCSCSTSLMGRAVTSRTVDANDGTGLKTWHYSYSYQSNVNGNPTLYTTVTDPLGNDTVHTMTGLGGFLSFYETAAQYFQGSQTSGTLLKTVTTDYQSTANAYDSSYVSSGNASLSASNSVTNVFPVRVTTTLANGLVKKEETDYDTALAYHGPLDGIQYNETSCVDVGAPQPVCNASQTYTIGPTNYSGTIGNVTGKREYDWGHGTPGPLLRQTLTNYFWQSNGSYFTYNFLDLASSSTVYDGSGNKVAQSTFGYDEYSLNPSGVNTQFNTSPVNGSIRGNQTSVHRWLNGSTTSTPNCAASASNGFLVSYTQYNDTGTVYKATDACGASAGDPNHTTTHSYSSTYAGAYPTQTCKPTVNGVTQCVNGTYDFNTGLLTSFTDANSQTTTYSYDNRWRIKKALFPPDPNGQRPETDFSYPSASEVDKSVLIISGQTPNQSSAKFDGLGRTIKAIHNSTGNTTVVTTYDPLGRVASVTNPYISTSESTYGIMQYAYDALGRVTQTTKQDGSITASQYDLASGNANCTLNTDEAGNQRRSCSDGLGRLVEVDEPQANSVGTSATASVSISGALQSYQLSAPPAALAGSGLAGYSDSSGNQHWAYLGSNSHLYNLYWTSAGIYGFDDVTALSGAPLASGTVVTGFPSSTAQFAYFDSNQHLYNLWWNGGTSYGFGDATATSGAPAAAAGSPLASFVDSSGGQHWAYFDTNQHVYNVYWNGHYGYGDATAGSGAPVAASGSSLTAFGDSGGGQHWAYLGTNQHIYNLYWTSSNGYGYQDATAGANAPIAAGGSRLASFGDSGSGQHWTYLDSSGNGYNLYWNCCGSYGNANLTSAVNAPAASGNAIAGFIDSGGSQHWAYFTGSQDVLNFWWANGAYTYQDATAGAGAPSAAPGSALVGFKDPWGGQHWAYFGTNQHVYNVWWNNGSYGYQDVNTATNLVYDAGTVSLSVGGMTATVCYGKSTNPACTNQPVNTTAAQVASALANAINVAKGEASASASGATINLTWKTPGPFTPTVSTLSTTHDNPGSFPNASFSSTAAAFAGGTGNLGSSPYVTLYGYDILGNLLRVDQKGTAPSDSSQWRTRLFTYDSLSRLLTAYNPESGTISYSYDANGNLLHKTSPALNQTGTATQTISYCYDQLNRITGKQYASTSCPLSSPAVQYFYDQASYGGLAITNGIGQLTGLTDQAGAGAYSYDGLGRMSVEQRTIAGKTKNMAYSYYLDNSLNKLTYPSGAVVTYTPDQAGRMVSAVDTTNNINYVTNASYVANSLATGYVNGNSSTFNGISNSFGYNRRLQPITISATAPNQTVFSIGYDFHSGQGDNGNVYAVVNYRDQSRNQSFTYDALNRLTSAQNAGTDCSQSTKNGKTEYWGNSYGYDAWGNLTQKVVTKCSAENLNEVAYLSNQLHTISGSDNRYDAAGNMIFDATTGLSYSYDPENRITGAAGYTYTYDADGNRVEKSNGSTGTIYWYMSPGIVGESDLTGALQSEYVFFGGVRVARRDLSANAVSYYFSDRIKSASVITDSAGNIKADVDYYPWGGELQFVNSDINHYKFTGKERDNETGMDYFGARYYGNWLGRFVTPDWATKPTTVPYADLKDPQSLNLYSYVRNRPTVMVDMDGHADASCPSGSTDCKAISRTDRSIYSTDSRTYIYVTQSTGVEYTDQNGNHVEKTSTVETVLTYSRDDGKQGVFLGAQQMSWSSTFVWDNSVNHNLTQFTSSYDGAKWQKSNMTAAEGLKLIGPKMVSKMLDAARPSVAWGAVREALKDSDEHPWHYVAIFAGGAAIPIAVGSVVGGALLGATAMVSQTVDDAQNVTHK